jgi:hypothetical protein
MFEPNNLRSIDFARSVLCAPRCHLPNNLHYHENHKSCRRSHMHNSGVMYRLSCDTINHTFRLVNLHFCMLLPNTMLFCVLRFSF